MGATPLRLLDTRNTTCLNGPCHRLSCMVWQSPDIQNRVFYTAIRAGLSPECWESTWARCPSLCAFRVFSLRQWEEGVSPGIPTCQHKVVVGSRGGIAPETPLRVGGLSASLPERTVSTVCKFPAAKKTVTSESHVSACTHATKKTQHIQCQALIHSFTHSFIQSVSLCHTTQRAQHVVSCVAHECTYTCA